MVRTLLMVLAVVFLSGCVEIVKEDFLDSDVLRLQQNGRNQAWIVPDVLFKDRSRIVSRDGETKAYIIPDILTRDSYRIQDPKTGETKGTIKRDVIFPDRLRILKGTW